MLLLTASGLVYHTTTNLRQQRGDWFDLKFAILNIITVPWGSFGPLYIVYPHVQSIDTLMLVQENLSIAYHGYTPYTRFDLLH